MFFYLNYDSLKLILSNFNKNIVKYQWKIESISYKYEYNILNGVIFMDLSQLGESAQYMVPLIILFCMCIGYVIKTSLDFIENKYIPLIMVSIGIGLNIWINKQVTAEIVVAGALSGLASIGTHQTCKNLNHNKKDQENNKNDNKDE